MYHNILHTEKDMVSHPCFIMANNIDSQKCNNVTKPFF